MRNAHNSKCNNGHFKKKFYAYLKIKYGKKKLQLTYLIRDIICYLQDFSQDQSQEYVISESMLYLRYAITGTITMKIEYRRKTMKIRFPSQNFDLKIVLCSWRWCSQTNHRSFIFYYRWQHQMFLGILLFSFQIQTILP